MRDRRTLVARKWPLALSAVNDPLKKQVNPSFPHTHVTGRGQGLLAVLPFIQRNTVRPVAKHGTQGRGHEKKG